MSALYQNNPHKLSVEEVVDRYKSSGMWMRVSNEFYNAAAGDPVTLSDIGQYYPGWEPEDFQAVIDMLER